MFKHVPKDYKCPICLGTRGIESDDTLLKKADLIYKDDIVSVFINSFWIDTVEGHVIVVPNEHYENIYELPEKVGHRIFDISKIMAQKIKEAYKCDGITIRQNNEPAGDQHAFHYHLHVFPRYDGDKYNQITPDMKRLSTPEERLEYINKLKSVE